jgi:hypothetical protein
MKRLLFAGFLLMASIPLTIQTGRACTNFLVTKGASTDGSTFITYAADSHYLFGELYFALPPTTRRAP